MWKYMAIDLENIETSKQCEQTLNNYDKAGWDILTYFHYTDINGKIFHRTILRRKRKRGE